MIARQASTVCGRAIRRIIVFCDATAEVFKVNASRLDISRSKRLGVASRNSGMFEIVQYLRKPTPLVSLVKSGNELDRLTSNVTVQSCRSRVKSACTTV